MAGGVCRGVGGISKGLAGSGGLAGSTGGG